jgi:phage FluMu protein Com
MDSHDSCCAGDGGSNLGVVLKWKCRSCGRLLGKEVSARMELKYKDMLYGVVGAEYTVIARCPRCTTRNERVQTPISDDVPEVASL